MCYEHVLTQEPSRLLEDEDSEEAEAEREAAREPKSAEVAVPA